jgi:CheY-like chemotaxis protein
MTFVVLLDRKAPDRAVVQNWLNNNGMVTWLANDIQHAIEELSDFTVRNKPDVVLLEVPLLNDSYDFVRSTLDMSTATKDITVLGMGDRSGNRPFAENLDQLNQMMQCKNH